MLLSGQSAVITGCNRGIGKAILQSFVHQGANVWACARCPSDEFSSLIKELSLATETFISPVYFDLANRVEIEQSAKSIMSTKIPVDILVNNAGAISTAPFQMTSSDAINEQYEVNFLSHIVFTQYMVRNMSRYKKGSIVNISSSAAIEGNEGRLAYAASKGAMLSATKVMARELSIHGIRVNSVAPGLTQTDMMITSTRKDALHEALEQTIMNRVGSPEEIAQVVLFLASDMSSYMTGQVLRVDGGM